ncbi:uncharacterized protein [Ptychodera flava]|uniref:uncharacterized protein n=1 Tax=Ptychodera flava TaxID=63121 RepID=UPI003969BFE9
MANAKSEQFAVFVVLLLCVSVNSQSTPVVTVTETDPSSNTTDFSTTTDGTTLPVSTTTPCLGTKAASDLEVLNLTYTSAVIVWAVPECLATVIGYRLSYDQSYKLTITSESVLFNDSSTSEHEILDMKPWTIYTTCIITRTYDGVETEGENSCVTFSTKYNAWNPRAKLAVAISIGLVIVLVLAMAAKIFFDPSQRDKSTVVEDISKDAEKAHGIETVEMKTEKNGHGYYHDNNLNITDYDDDNDSVFEKQEPHIL